MSPAISPLVSALERASELIDKGAKPAAALRQVAWEMSKYADIYGHQHIPSRSFSAELAEFARGRGAEDARRERLV